jgi:hypothetical protein
LFNRVTYNYSSSLTIPQEANRYQIMIMQSTNASVVAQLKAANPNLKIFVYQDLTHPDPGEPNGLTTCSPYSADQANPSWFLHDQNGKPIEEMDPGNTGYQQECAAHSIALAKADGFDGIFWDEVNGNPFLANGITCPEYPTVASWQTAMVSLMGYAYPLIHQAGLQVIGNIGFAAQTTNLWQDWNAYMDGAMQEVWTGGSNGLVAQIPYWPGFLADAAWSEAHGKYAVLHSYDGTEAGNTYGLASMLLIAGGESSYSTSTTYTSNENWFPEFATAQQLGAPSGAYSKLSNGVYERVFANGIVLVNPTANTIPSFSLGGNYTGSGLTNVNSVSMAPTSGLILLRAS